MKTTLAAVMSWRRALVGWFAVAAIFAGARPTSAQVLLVSPTTISFPSSDPDTVPVISAASVRLTYLTLGLFGTPWTITVRADGPLVSGASTIPISNVSWTATPAPPFRNGTLSTVAQTLGSGTGLAILQTGDVTFRFANSWNYNVGNYTQTITFTLSSP